jgi:type II secretory pathway pseudopilin PulG
MTKMSRIGLHSDERGLTLLELIVAATLVASTSLALLSSFIYIRQVSNFARNEALSSLAAQDEIERIRNQSYYSIPVGSNVIDFTADLPSDLPSPKSGLVDVTALSAQLKQLDLEITYRQGSSTRTMTYTTYMGIPGLTQ